MNDDDKASRKLGKVRKLLEAKKFIKKKLKDKLREQTFHYAMEKVFEPSIDQRKKPLEELATKQPEINVYRKPFVMEEENVMKQLKHVTKF